MPLAYHFLALGENNKALYYFLETASAYLKLEDNYMVSGRAPLSSASPRGVTHSSSLPARTPASGNQIAQKGKGLGLRRKVRANGKWHWASFKILPPVETGRESSACARGWGLWRSPSGTEDARCPALVGRVLLSGAAAASTLCLPRTLVHSRDFLRGAHFGLHVTCAQCSHLPLHHQGPGSTVTRPQDRGLGRASGEASIRGLEALRRTKLSGFSPADGSGL